MSIERVITSEQSPLYEVDFLQWLQEQHKALRNRNFSQLDIANLAEEIEDLGKNLKREVASRLEVLIAHLIKLSVSEEQNPKAGWRGTVREQRRQLEKIFESSPSLRRYADEAYQRCLARAKSDAYLALIDYQPSRAAEYEEKIRAGWNLVEIEHVLETGTFLDIGDKDLDRPEF